MEVTTVDTIMDIATSTHTDTIIATIIMIIVITMERPSLKVDSCQDVAASNPLVISIHKPVIQATVMVMIITIMKSREAPMTE
jgi:hypothetical protein